MQSTVEDGTIIYEVEGQLFFASVEGFIDAFDYSHTSRNVVIDFSNAHIWDDSAVGAVDKVMLRYQEKGIQVKLSGLDSSSKKILDKLAIYSS